VKFFLIFNLVVWISHFYKIDYSRLSNLIYNDGVRHIKNVFYENILSERGVFNLVTHNISRIKGVVLDLDGTITFPGERTKESMIDKICKLIDLGYKIAIVTGRGYEEVEKMFLDAFPDGFKKWDAITIYPSGGAAGYSVDEGKIDLVYPYYEGVISAEQVQLIDRTIEEFRKKFGLKDLKVKYRRGSNNTVEEITLYKIPLLQDESIIEEYLNFFKERFRETGVQIHLNIGGKSMSIDINILNKFDALNDFMQRYGFEAENLVICGDSFSGEFGNDRDLILPGSLIFNVGVDYNVPNEVFSFDMKDPEGTEQVLEFIRKIKIFSDFLMQSQQEQYSLQSLQKQFSRLDLTQDGIREIFKVLIQDEKIPEYFEVVNNRNELTGVFKRRDVVHQDGDWHRGSQVIIVNSDGKILLQLRGPEQDCPNTWDISTTGHVRVGESYLMAAVREIKEEIGVVVDPDRLILVRAEGFFKKTGAPEIIGDSYQEMDYKYKWDKGYNNEFISLYVYPISKEEETQLKAGREVAEIKFVDINEELDIYHASPHLYSDSFRHYFGNSEVLNLLFSIIRGTRL